MNNVYIGIGTNLGSRRENLKRALEELAKDKRISIVKQSSVRETLPVDYTQQPLFLNMIVLIETDCAPDELLEVLKGIEIDMGRKKTMPRGPRIIDLDILLYGQEIVELPGLTVPHREILNRPFIVDHLIELNPYITDPVTGKKYSEA